MPWSNGAAGGPIVSREISAAVYLQVHLVRLADVMNLSVPAINFALLSICIALFSAKAATAATSHAFEASLVEPISG